MQAEEPGRKKGPRCQVETRTGFSGLANGERDRFTSETEAKEISFLVLG